MNANSSFPGRFPTTRLRRLRHNPAVRRMAASTTLEPRHCILPLFVREGEDISSPIKSMPGQAQLSIDRLVTEAQHARDLGLGGIILFGIPAQKDNLGSDATTDAGIIAKAVRAVKSAVPELLVMTDLCFCEYTDHGHCGPLREVGGRTEVDNDATLDLLGQQAVTHATAGADLIAPSGMMDGMVGAIREALDADGFTHVPILSYAAKYASGFYGPFRDAAESAPRFGDRRGYQMDFAAASGQALREVALDLAEGADMIMVKPAMAYLDILAGIRESFPGVPLAAYHVSGEYSMIKAAAANGWIDERAIALESLTAIRRAGADFILTYFARDVANWLA